MVSANTVKELQNVLPKCNPFRPDLLYDFRRDGILAVYRILTSINAHNQHKNQPVHLLLVPLVVHFVTISLSNHVQSASHNCNINNIGNILDSPNVNAAATAAKCQSDTDDYDKRSNPVDDISDN